MSMLLRYMVAVTLSSAMVFGLVHSADDTSDKRGKTASALIDAFGTTAVALYTVAKADAQLNVGGDKYERLARRVGAEIELGQAASKLTRVPFDLASNLFKIGAVADPEPGTRIIFAISSYGSREIGEAASAAILNAAEKSATSVLARALKESKFTARQLADMSSKEFSASVDTLRISGQTMREILRDQPVALEVLKAHAEDFARQTGAATLLQTKATALDVAGIKKTLTDTAQSVHDFRKETKKRFQTIENGLTDLKVKANQATQDIAAMRKELGTSVRNIQMLAQVSSMQWTIEQKLAAIEGGMFPELTVKEQTAVTKSLRSQLSVERSIQGLQAAAQDLQSIATIASRLGVDPKVVDAVRSGQAAATGIAKIVSGDFLGGLASLSGILGLGSDPEAERHAALMQYLSQEFGKINEKLNAILQLQQETLKALVAISRQLAGIQTQLQSIERFVILNHSALQYLLLDEWKACDAMMGSLNDQSTIESLDQLVAVLSDTDAKNHISKCYQTYAEFFDKAKSGRWAGGPLSEALFPRPQISDDAGTVVLLSQDSKAKQAAYSTARAFLLAALTDTSTAPAHSLIALAEPAPTIDAAKARDDRLIASAAILDSFKCNQSGVLNASLTTLLCVGLPLGRASPPLPDAWLRVVNETLLGPQVLRLIDIGVPLATLSDFVFEDSSTGVNHTVPIEELKRAADLGISRTMSTALAEMRGEKTIARLEWLFQAYLLQQSVAYGDFTAQRIVDVLYDASAKSLRASAAEGNRQQALAFAAMRENPILARNVVLIAMRKALSTGFRVSSQKTPVPAATFYALAVANFSGPLACGNDATAKKYLDRALPNWAFALRAEPGVEEKSLSRCQQGDVKSGGGLVILFKDFEVKAPSPWDIQAGQFEYAQGLRIALKYRAQLASVRVLRGLGKYVSEVQGVSKEQFARVSVITFLDGFYRSHGHGS